MNPNGDHSDIAIIGGGPVGAALALALTAGTERALEVTVLEARAAAASQDPRPIALSHGSRLLLERLGAWDALTATPIAQIHVSQKGAFGRAALTASEARVPALGYVVDYGMVHAALMAAMRIHARCRYQSAARADAIGSDSDGAHVAYMQNETRANLSARLLVVADGGDIEGIAPAKVTDYGQCALTARVRTSLPHQNTAYERFTHEGPLALLPFGAEMGLVWTLAPARAEALRVTDEKLFLTALREAFGARLGEFTAVSTRAVYPLTLRQNVDAPPRVVAIGNAAQTLHPVAGQGFNLGLRDAWELALALKATPREQIGERDTLRQYLAARRVDRQATLNVTHGLVRLFSNENALLNATRGVGMTLFGCVPPLRDFLARRMIFGARG